MVANCANTLDCGELSVDAVMALRASDSNGQLVTLQAILGDITTSIRYRNARDLYMFTLPLCFQGENCGSSCY